MWGLGQAPKEEEVGSSTWGRAEHFAPQGLFSPILIPDSGAHQKLHLTDEGVSRELRALLESHSRGEERYCPMCASVEAAPKQESPEWRGPWQMGELSYHRAGFSSPRAGSCWNAGPLWPNLLDCFVKCPRFCLLDSF